LSDEFALQHGIKRIRQSKEAIEEKARKEQSKIKDYLALTQDVLARVGVVTKG
jgi:geranylgeranyl transferase type-2 subunit alpha